MNIMKKCTFAHVGSSVYPENKGNQCAKPPIMANTAPIDNT